MREFRLHFFFPTLTALMTGVLFVSSSCAAGAPTPHDSQAVGLSVGASGLLLKSGKVFRGIGVNYYDAFFRTLTNPRDTSYIQGFKTLESLNVPFVRFTLSGSFPADFALYQTDKNSYFRLLDEFIRAAEQHNIGLIPSFYWNHATLPDIVGESVGQWGNENSRTIAFMRKYTVEVVSRYRNSPAIWGWEFGNETNLWADRNDARRFPIVRQDKGTPPVRTERDRITFTTIATAMREFVQTIRALDPHRIVISGSAIPVPEAFDNPAKKGWREQYAIWLQRYSPDPIDTISLHLYPSFVSRYFAKTGARLDELVQTSMDVSAQLKKPLLILEFGATRSDYSLDLGKQIERDKFEEMLKAIEHAGVPLAAVWVFDFSEQDKDWNITLDNDRAYQLKAIAAANARIQAEKLGVPQ